jgi:DNA-binding CsgD family transcriptional regulator
MDNLSVADMAVRLRVSERTVRAHLEHVYRKLGIRNARDLLLLLFAACLDTRR